MSARLRALRRSGRASVRRLTGPSWVSWTNSNSIEASLDAFLEYPSPASPAQRARARVAALGGSGPGARIRKWREDRLDLFAQVLERLRKDERLAQVLHLLVDAEARTERRYLEEDAA